VNCGLCHDWKLTDDGWNEVEVEWSKDHAAMAHIPGPTDGPNTEWQECWGCNRMFMTWNFKGGGRYIVVGWDSAGGQMGWCYNCALQRCAQYPRLALLEKFYNDDPNQILATGRNAGKIVQLLTEPVVLP
jgi:hypothetical protein